MAGSTLAVSLDMSPKSRKSHQPFLLAEKGSPDHAMVSFLLAFGQERREVGRKLLENYPRAGHSV